MTFQFPNPTEKEFSMKRQESELQTNECVQAYASMSAECQWHDITDFEDDLIDYLCGENGGTPFAFEPRLAFRAGEVTLWGGVNGHGKSLILGQTAMQLAEAGDRVGIISLEMLPKWTTGRMERSKLAYRRGSLSREQAEEIAAKFVDRLKGKISLLGVKGPLTVKHVIGAAIVAAQAGFNHVVIDNLMNCVTAEAGDQGMNEQKQFVRHCCIVAQMYNVHIHLVHHVRKGENEDAQIDKFSFRGSSAIVDQVDNAILIQRVRAKERKRAAGALSPADDASVGDSVLIIAKQRNGDFEGDVPLWFNKKFNAFCLTPERRPCWKVEQPKPENGE